MSDRRGYQGFSVTGIDAKGRAAIPADLRAALDVNGAASRVTIALHDSAPCLIAYDPAFADIRGAKIEARTDARLDAGDEIDLNIARMAFAMTDTVTYDSSGRFVCHPYFAAKAKLEKGVPLFFIGVGGYFEIWNMDVLEAEPSVAEPIKDAARFMRAQWSAK